MHRHGLVAHVRPEAVSRSVHRRRHTIAVAMGCVALASVVALAQEAVDPRTGELHLQVTDLVVQAGPMNLEVTRTYQPAGVPRGALGSGWQLNWESSLQYTGDGAVILQSGTALAFQARGSDRELVATGGDRLELTGDGRAIHRDVDGIVTVYRIEEGVGRMAERGDPNGNNITLHYGNDGSLSRIEGPRGSFLDFAVDASGRVTEISSSMSSRVEYRYEKNRLAEVRVDGGPPERYSYDQAGLLVAIDRPATGRVELSYDERGRVIARSWADGGEERYEYIGLGRQTRLTLPTGGVTTYRWSEDGLRQEVTDPLGHTTTTEYDSELRPIAVTDAGGATTRWTYDELGRTVRIEGPGGRTTHVEYLGDTSLPTAIHQPDGTTWSYEYDAAGNLLTETVGDLLFRSYAYLPDGMLESIRGMGRPELHFSYDRNGLLHSERDALGRITSYEYDQRGNPVVLTEPGGRTTHWSYDAQGRLTAETDPAGATTSYGYDSAGRLVAVEDPLGSVTRYSYDAAGRVASAVDALGRATSFSYRLDGQVKTITDPAGHETCWSYDEKGRPVDIADSIGSVTAYQYDQLDRLLAVTEAGGERSAYTWGSDGSLIGFEAGGLRSTVDIDTGGEELVDSAGDPHRVVRDPLGRVIETESASGERLRYRYDAAGNLVAIEGDHDLATRFEYDPAGRRTRTVLPTGLEITYRYDAADHVVGVMDSLGGSVGTTYDDAGRVVAVTDSVGDTTRFRYDAAGRLTSRSDALGNTTSYSYDDAGQLLEVIGPSGDRVAFSYDPAGWLAAVRDPDGRTTRYERDARGNAVRAVDPLGHSISRRFDAGGRLVEEKDPAGGVTTLGYDEEGRLARVSRPDGVSVRYRYDSEGRPVEVDDGIFPVRYQYDANGNVTRISYPVLRREIAFTYDERGRRTYYTDPAGRSHLYHYDSLGRLEGIDLPDGDRIGFSYDAKDRLTATAYPNGVVERSTYDAAGRIVAVEDVDRAGAIVAARYSTFDAAGNPSSVKDSDGDVTRFRYDAAGQLVEVVDAGGSTRFEYLPGGRRASALRDGTTVAFAYDDSGRLVRAGDESFRYDARGNVVSRTGPGGSTHYRWDADDHLIEARLADGRTISYGYAPTGDRIWREDDTGRTWYLGDGDNLVATLDGDLEVASTYLHAPGLDRPLVTTTAAGARYTYLRDPLGSITGLADSAGVVAARYRTDAFGMPEAPSSGPPNPFLFTARTWDPALGLYDFRQRAYDPRLGRFLSPDPLQAEIATPLDLERYAYARNAPTRYVDPLGLRVDAFDKMILLQGSGDPVDANALQAVRRLSETYGGPGGEIAKLVMAEYRHQQNLWGLRDVVPRPQHLGVSEPSLARAVETVENQLDLTRLHHRPGVDPRSPTSRLEGTRRFLQQQQQREFQRVLRAVESQGTRLHGQYGPSPPTTQGGAAGSRAAGATRIGSPPPESGSMSSGGGSSPAAPAVPPGSSGSVAVAEAAPPPQVKPTFRGHRPLGETNADWQRIPKPAPPPPKHGLAKTWADYTKPPTAGQSIVLTATLTAEMIARCRGQGLTAGECADRFVKGLWENKVLIGVTTITLFTPAGPVVLTALTLYKGVTDIVDFYYAHQSAAEAQSNLERILKERKRGTDLNLELELEGRLRQMRARIEQTGAELTGACQNLERVAADASAMADEAEEIEREVRAGPMPASILPGGAAGSGEAAAGAGPTTEAMIDNLGALQGQVSGLMASMRADLGQAKSLAQACASKESASRLLALTASCSDSGRRIRTLAEGGRRAADALAERAAQDAAKGQLLRDYLSRVRPLRDRLIAMAQSAPTAESIDAEVRRAAAAKDLLTEPPPSHATDVDNLMKAFGDKLSLDSSIEYKFWELKQLAASYPTDSCRPEEYPGKVRDAADRIVRARLNAQQLIEDAESRLDLVAGDPSRGRSLAESILQTADEAATALTSCGELEKIGRDCLAKHGGEVVAGAAGEGGGPSGGSEDEGKPPLVEASKTGSESGGGSNKPPAVDASKAGGTGTGGDSTKPPVVGASKPGSAPPAGSEELVYANVDIELAQDDYGIYDILDHISDSEVIVKTPQGEKQLLGVQAVTYLSRRGWIVYRDNVGWVASDRLKRFLGIGETEEPGGGGGKPGKPEREKRPSLGGMTYDGPVQEHKPDDPTTPEGKRKLLQDLSWKCQRTPEFTAFWNCIWSCFGDDCRDACTRAYEENEPQVCREADALAAEVEKLK